MSLYGAFAKAQHFAEIADNAIDQHGNLLTPTERRNTAFQNLLGDTSFDITSLNGLTSTATELNLLDGSDSDIPVASTAAILNSGGDLITASNVGVSAATSVLEYGDGFHHVTVLTLTGLSFSAEPDNASLAVGDLIYTLPAGAKMLESAYMNIALNQTGDVKTDNFEIGLGTVIGTGAVSVLNGTATFEDIITGQVETGTQDGTNFTVTAALPTVGAPLFFASADARTIHVNVAAVWSDIDTSVLTYSGTVVLVWKFLE